MVDQDRDQEWDGHSDEIKILISIAVAVTFEKVLRNHNELYIVLQNFLLISDDAKRTVVDNRFCFEFLIPKFWVINVNHILWRITIYSTFCLLCVISRFEIFHCNIRTEKYGSAIESEIKRIPASIAINNQTS